MIKKSSSNKTTYRWYALVLGLIILAGSSFYLPNNFFTLPGSSETKPVKPEATFTSPNLNFSIRIPNGMKATESYTSVTLTNDDGAITIGRNTTSYNTIDEYVATYEKQNTVDDSQSEHQTIHGFDMIRLDRRVDSQIIRRSYFVLIDQWVYVIETANESLFPQLESVANSFQYTSN